MLKIIILLLISSTTLALTPHKIEYKLFAKGFEIGTETRILSKNLNTYTYTASAKTEGLAKFIKNYKINAQSVFTFTDEIDSKKFTSKEWDDDKIKKNINLTFEKNQVFSSKQSWQANTKIVDFLNLFLTIGDDLKQNKTLNYLLANGKQLKTYNFKNEGMETIDIMDENIKTIKLSADGLIVYIAPNFDYMPVLIKKKSWKYEMKLYQKL